MTQYDRCACVNGSIGDMNPHAFGSPVVRMETHDQRLYVQQTEWSLCVSVDALYLNFEQFFRLE